MCKLGVVSQERLKIEVKLLLSANRKSYMRRRLAQQQMSLSDLEWPRRALSLRWLSFLSYLFTCRRFHSASMHSVKLASSAGWNDITHAR